MDVNIGVQIPLVHTTAAALLAIVSVQTVGHALVAICLSKIELLLDTLPTCFQILMNAKKIWITVNRLVLTHLVATHVPVHRVID